jgi:hypothetical protein
MTQTKLESNLEAPKQKKTGLTVTQSIISGSVAGAGEVFTNHPLWVKKRQIQNNELRTNNLKVLYKGIWPNAASMIPISALQVGLNRFFQQTFFKKSELTDTQRLTTAFAAGVSSSFISCPTEMIMTHQKKSFYAAGTQLVRQGGT